MLVCSADAVRGQYYIIGVPVFSVETGECKVSKLGVNERSYLAPAGPHHTTPPSDDVLIFKLAKYPARFGNFQQTLSQLQSGPIYRPGITERFREYS